MIVQFRNEKVSNHGSIPITIACNVVAFIVFEEGFHQPIKHPKHYTRAFGDGPRKFEPWWTTPELAPPPPTTTPHQREDVSALNRFNVHRCPTRRVFSARATIDLLKDTLGDRLISRFGPVDWPPRSCDLTPLDYFLWGYVKSLVYADKPQTLDHLEDNIRRVIADIRPQMLEKVIENWTSRLDYIRASRGSPMPEIIFKM
ncbi:hypothetical protein TNCV_2418291 [Trichonephila clavipes]|nr:hypothetical protein TNCV_2418291 [Trichonephila clavipes]